MKRLPGYPYYPTISSLCGQKFSILHFDYVPSLEHEWQLFFDHVLYSVKHQCLEGKLLDRFTFVAPPYGDDFDTRVEMLANYAIINNIKELIWNWISYLSTRLISKIILWLSIFFLLPIIPNNGKFEIGRN